MATSLNTTLVSPSNSTADQAAVRIWGAAVSALFSGGGLTQASDTGQINWSTVTVSYPGTNSNSTVGYEVWRFNDSLQATKPVFLIVTYILSRSGGSGVNSYIQIKFCTSTNGAGASTSTLASVVSMNAGVGSTWAGNATCMSSGDGSYFNLAMGTNFTSAGVGGCGLIYVDRTRDSSGSGTGEGIIFGSAGTNGGSTSTIVAPQFSTFGFTSNVLFSPTVGSGSGIGFPVPPPYASMSAGTTVGLLPATAIINGKLLPPFLCGLTYLSSDITAGTTIAVPISGTSHSYYCLGAFSGAMSYQNNTGASVASAVWAMRYE